MASESARIQLVPNLPPDAELLARIHDPDEGVARAAFSALFTAVWVPLCKWAYYFTRDRTAAEELVADVLANVWHRREHWAPRESIVTYLFGAVRTQVRYEFRNLDHRAELQARYVTPDRSPGMGAPAAAADTAAQTHDLRTRLDRAMQALSGRARAAIMYRFYDGLEYDEIALRLGTTDGAIRVLVTRAFKTLRALVPPD